MPDGRNGRRQRNAVRLFDAACELLTERSYDEVTVDAICERAEVGRATFFRIYGSKGGLLRELNRRLTDDAQERLAAGDTSDAYTRLDTVRTAIVDAWNGADAAQMAMAREFIRNGSLLEPHAAHPELAALVRGIVADGVSSGELHSQVPVDLAASLALVQLVAPVAYLLGEPTEHRVDIDAVSSTLFEQWYQGMATHPLRADGHAR